MQKEKKMTTTLNQKQLEEFAFYESGLSADGCLQKLDSYTIEAIERYGKILVEKQKENFANGFQGSCYCCEPVGMLNQKLEEIARRLYSVVIHLQQVAKTSAVVVVGSGLYSEAVNAINEYEDYNANS